MRVWARFLKSAKQKFEICWRCFNIQYFPARYVGLHLNNEIYSFNIAPYNVLQGAVAQYAANQEHRGQPLLFSKCTVFFFVRCTTLLWKELQCTSSFTLTPCMPRAYCPLSLTGCLSAYCPLYSTYRLPSWASDSPLSRHALPPSPWRSVPCQPVPPMCPSLGLWRLESVHQRYQFLKTIVKLCIHIKVSKKARLNGKMETAESVKKSNSISPLH